MNLINLQIPPQFLERIAKALEGIHHSLEALIPKPLYAPDRPYQPPEDLEGDGYSVQTDQDTLLQEMETKLKWWDQGGKQEYLNFLEGEKTKAEEKFTNPLGMP